MKIAGLIILSLLPVALSQKALSSSSSEENVRVKRAGFSLITGALQNLQKSAFGASASLAAGSSSSSSGSSGSSSSSPSNDVHSHTYGHSHSSGSDYEEPQHDTKSFDGWQLKKSILNTLLQAVKAIAGGVTTLKGQLIKGSGYLVSQKGKLIASGGDAVSNAGKNIINSAHLIHPETSGHGQSFGHSLGSKFGGLTKSISGLSSGSSGSIASLSSGSSGSIASLSSGSSGSSSGHSSGSGHSSDTSSHSHGDAYAAVEGPSFSYNIPESHSYDSYGPPKVAHESYGPPKVVHESYGPPKIVHDSYGPPKPTISYLQEPHSAYGAPEYNDGSYKSSSHQDASDVLSEILKNLPHKPMKSIGYELVSDGHSFKQIPIPDDVPPPFKPLNHLPSYDLPFESHKLAPEYYSDYSGQSSNKKPIAVNPKAYDIYHTMKRKLTKEKSNFVTLPTINDKGLEIQKSVGFEIKI